MRREKNGTSNNNRCDGQEMWQRQTERNDDRKRHNGFIISDANVAEMLKTQRRKET